MTTLPPAEIDHHLRETLPPGLLKLIDLISQQAIQMGVEVYLIGGFVRDLIMKRRHFDLDFVIDSHETGRDAIGFSRALSEKHGGKTSSYDEFRTASWTLTNALRNDLGVNEGSDLVWVDFASARTERYAHPGALPTVELSDIKSDLKRRDFTINAMAVRLADKTLIDPFGGQIDIEAGIIRVLHDLSFIDDPTRIFRAARFAARFNFRLDPHTEALINGGLPHIAAVSGERLRHVLDLIFREAEPEKALNLLDRWGALKAIDPNLRMDAGVAAGFAAWREIELAEIPLEALRAFPPLVTSQFSYWPIFAAPIEPIAPILARLPFDRTTKISIEQTKRAVAFDRTAGDIPTSEYVRGIEPFDNQFAQTAAIAIAHAEGRDTERLTLYSEEWRYITPRITGDDLKALGLTPGPLFGKILRQLRDDLLDGKITHEQEIERLKELIAQEQSK